MSLRKLRLFPTYRHFSITRTYVFAYHNTMICPDVSIVRKSKGIPKSQTPLKWLQSQLFYRFYLLFLHLLHLASKDLLGCCSAVNAIRLDADHYASSDFQI